MLRKEKLPYFKSTSGRILVLSTFFSVVIATLAFRLYAGGDVVDICIDDSSNRFEKDPKWKKLHKARVIFAFFENMKILVNTKQRLMKI